MSYLKYNHNLVSIIIPITLLLLTPIAQGDYPLPEDYDSSYSPAFVSTFGSNGTDPGQFYSPNGISVDNNSIYVIDNNRLQIYDLSGNVELAIDTFSSAPSNFLNPTDVVVNQDIIYVSDTGNDRIVVFDHLGIFKFEFGTSGSTNGTFNSPGYMAINNEFIFISDRGNERIQVFDLLGNFNFTFGSAGTGDGEFSNPLGIDVDENHIFVVDSYLLTVMRVQAFDLNGNYKYQSDIWALTPNGLTIHDDRIVVTDLLYHSLAVYNYDLGGESYGLYGGKEPGDLGLPRSITSNDTHLLITEGSNGRVSVFERNGAPTNVSILLGLSSVTLTWAPPSNWDHYPVTSYRIYRGIEGGEYKFLHETSDFIYVDHAILEDFTYQYVITAITETGETKYSEEVFAWLPIGKTVTQTVNEKVFLTEGDGKVPLIPIHSIFLSITIFALVKKKRK